MKWNTQTQSKNPPFNERTPVALQYLRWFDTESAYVPQQGLTELQQAYKERLYTSMITIMTAGSGIPEMRVARRWPHGEWETVWKNLREASVSETSRVARYGVVHDILPKNKRLHMIYRTPTDTFRNCDNIDTFRNHLNACGEGRSIWDWMKKQIAHNFRTVPDRISDEWVTHSQFKL